MSDGKTYTGDELLAHLEELDKEEEEHEFWNPS